MKYATYKTFHNWLGLFLLLPIMLTSLTGILWMHEKTLGIKSEGEKPMKMSKAIGVVSGEEENSNAVAFALWTPDTMLAENNLQAMQLAISAAKEVWGDANIELSRIELKDDERLGRIVKLVSKHESADLPHELSWSIAEESIVDRKGGPKLANGQGGTDWAKVVHDLHTGKWFSANFGFLWSDLGALAILFLGITGVILYAMPIMKKRENRKKRSSASPPVARPALLESRSTAPARPVVVAEIDSPELVLNPHE